MSSAYLQTGEWIPQSEFITRTGLEPVRYFFVITAFLFWPRIMANSKIAAPQFLKKRFCRLMPVYYAATFALISVAVLEASQGGQIKLFSGVKALIPWVTVGLPFGDFTHLFDGQKTWTLQAGVLWTLRWEWLFYLALPLVSLKFSGNRKTTWAVLVMGAMIGAIQRLLPGLFVSQIGTLVFDSAKFITCYFGPGMVLAHLAYRNQKDLKSFMMASLVLAACTAPFREFETAYAVAAFIVAGAILQFNFGKRFFSSKTMHSLGAMSYSIYLWHGLFLSGSRELQRRIPGLITTPASYWAFITFVILPLVLTASYFSYQWLERPFLGKSPQTITEREG